MGERPKIRAHELTVEELDEGLVIYDGAAGRAHSLAAEVARVWRTVDGSRTLDEIALVAGVLRADAIAALDEFDRRGLLEPTPGLSRRAAVKRAALLSAAAVGTAPVIETVLIPVAAAHASTPTGTGGGGTGGGPTFVLNGSLIEGSGDQNGVTALFFADTGAVGAHTISRGVSSIDVLVDLPNGQIEFSIVPFAQSSTGFGIKIGNTVPGSTAEIYQVFNANHSVDLGPQSTVTLALDSSLHASIFTIN